MVDYKNLFIEALNENKDNPKWDEGYFIGIKTISNTKVGAVGQDFIEKLCDEYKFLSAFPLNKEKKRSKQSPWDIEINGVKFELKTATEDVGGSFQFNHLRYHRSYDAVLCLGVTPNELYFFVASKADVSIGKAGKLVTMEKGANASYKLTKKPKDLHKIDEFYSVIFKFTENFEH